MKLGGKTRKAHRLSYEHYVGPIPDGQIVRHTCDVAACVNPNHLVLGTNADNSADMVRRGRSLDGERNHKAKLTAPDVLEMRRLRETQGATYASLGRQFGVTSAAARFAVVGHTWRNI